MNSKIYFNPGLKNADSSTAVELTINGEIG
jgi:hypothetical protein